MDYNGLQTFISNQLPGPGSGTLTIASTDDPAIADNSTVGELLTYCYDGGPLVIDNAAIDSHDENAKIIVVSGTSDYLGVTGMSVTATFSIDTNADVQQECMYTLADTWTFSDSFTSLPQVTDFAQPVTYYAIA